MSATRHPFATTSNPPIRLEMLESASQLLILGTSLATYSAFRLVKQAHEQKKPILMISMGPSRADRSLSGFEEVKMDRLAGPVLRAYLDEALRWVLRVCSRRCC